MKLLILIGLLVAFLLINFIFGSKIFSVELMKGLSRKIFKKILILGVMAVVSILIIVQVIKTSEAADSQIEEQARQQEIQQYQENKKEEFERKVSPFRSELGGVWYPYKHTAIKNEDGVMITDYSIKIDFIDEINAQVSVNYMEGDTPRSEILEVNYHSDDHPAFIHGMEATIESKDGNPYGGGRFNIEEPRRAYKDQVGCSDCKDVKFQIGEEAKLKNFPNLIVIGGFYSRTKSSSQTNEAESTNSAAIENNQNTSQEPIVESTQAPKQPEQSKDSTNNSSENNQTLNQGSQQVSPLAQKMDRLQGAWKRVTPIGEGDYHISHDVRYIFIKKPDYSSSPEWRIGFDTQYDKGIYGYVKEKELELLDNQTIATKKRPQVNPHSSGYIIKVTSSNTISVQHLSFDQLQIVTEEFRSVSRSEIEDEYVGTYDIVVGK